MTRDDIIRMVRDNGLRMSVQGSYFFIGFDDLGKLLDVRAASEREACAKRAAIALLGTLQTTSDRVLAAIRRDAQ